MRVIHICVFAQGRQMEGRLLIAFGDIVMTIIERPELLVAVGILFVVMVQIVQIQTEVVEVTKQVQKPQPMLDGIVIIALVARIQDLICIKDNAAQMVDAEYIK